MILTNEIKNQFIDLYCRLSPENLSMDGELTRTATTKRYNKLMAEWKLREKQIKFKVTDAHVENWMKENNLTF